MQSVYEAAGGRPGLERVAAAWHARVMADDVVRHAFHEGAKPDHVQRLASYWGQALGGPPDYTDSYGDESSVVRRHAGNGEHDEMDDRAIACFGAALDEAGLSDPVRAVVLDYFTWSTRVNMNSYPGSRSDVPEGLSVPQWSWDGPVTAS